MEFNFSYITLLSVNESLGVSGNPNTIPGTKNMTLTITHSSARPSDRFIQIVAGYFGNQGFTYKKSQKEFITKFEKGTKTVGFYFRIGTLTTATLHWSIHFEKFQKLIGYLFDDPKRHNKSNTIGSDICNYTRNADLAFKLYDEQTLSFDDFSINKAATLSIKAYEEYAVPYFEKFTSYTHLEEHYNLDKFKNIGGIILAKYVDNPRFDLLVQALYEQAHIREKISPSNELTIIDKTITFLRTNNIKAVLV